MVASQMPCQSFLEVDGVLGLLCSENEGQFLSNPCPYPQFLPQASV